MAIDINIPSQVKTYANLAAFPATGSLKTIFIAEDTNKTYRWTGSAYVEISASQATAWGAITGTLSAQTDLNTALSGKQDDITLTTTGTSGASTFVANTLNVPAYSLSGLGGVPTTRTLTINGTTQDLSADRTFTISTGITIGTTAITSGTVGRVLFEGAGNVVSESANLFWDNTNGRLGIGGTPGAFSLDVNGTARVQGLTTIRTLASSYNSPLIVENTGSAAVDNKNVAAFIGARGNASNIDDNTNIGIWQKSNIVNNYGIVNYFNSAGNLSAYFGAQYVTHGVNPIGNLIFGTSNGSPATRMTIFAGGNVGINTTTDAGFKLDVNGTARVGNISQITNANSITAGYQGGFVLTGGVGSLKQDATTYNKTLLDCGYEGGLRIRPYSVGFTSYVDVRSDTSSALTVTSTNQGFLPPRMTTTQKNAIATPAEGLQVWDTTLKLMSVYNGTTWITL